MSEEFDKFKAELDEMSDEAREGFIAMWGEPEEMHPDLVPYRVELEHAGMWVKHPLVFSMLYHPALNKELNGTYRLKVKALADAEDAGKWVEAIMLYERPHRFEALERMQDFMTDREFWEMASEVWTDSENIWQHEEEWIELLNSERSGRDYMMDDGEKMFLSLLPAVVTVYRGYSRDGRADGLSWTHDASRAAFFAKYLLMAGGRPRVVTGKVRKTDILAVFDGRNENEIVVCEPDCVYDREEWEIATAMDID